MASRSRSVAKIWSIWLRTGFEFILRFFEEDGQGIRFLPGRAAGDPDPQGLAGRAVLQQHRDDPGFQFFPRRRVAEKTGDPDQEFLEQQFQFWGFSWRNRT